MNSVSMGKDWSVFSPLPLFKVISYQHYLSTFNSVNIDPERIYKCTIVVFSPPPHPKQIETESSKFPILLQIFTIEKFKDMNKHAIITHGSSNLAIIASLDLSLQYYLDSNSTID